MGRAHRVGAGRGLDLHLVGSEWVEDNATGPPWRIHPGSRQDGGVIGGLKKKKAKHNFWNYQADCKTLGGLTPVSLVCHVTC